MDEPTLSLEETARVARALLARGELEHALPYWDKLIQAGIDHGYTYEHRAYCLRVLGWHLEAIDDYTAMIQRRPRASSLYFDRSLSRAAVGDIAGCIADSEQAFRLARRFEWFGFLNRAARELGYKNAKSQYGEYLELAKRELEGKSGMATLRKDYPDVKWGPDSIDERRRTARRRPSV